MRENKFESSVATVPKLALCWWKFSLYFFFLPFPGTSRYQILTQEANCYSFCFVVLKHGSQRRKPRPVLSVATKYDFTRLIGLALAQERFLIRWYTHGRALFKFMKFRQVPHRPPKRRLDGWQISVMTRISTVINFTITRFITPTTLAGYERTPFITGTIRLLKLPIYSDVNFLSSSNRIQVPNLLPSWDNHPQLPLPVIVLFCFQHKQHHHDAHHPGCVCDLPVSRPSFLCFSIYHLLGRTSPFVRCDVAPLLLVVGS